MQLCCKKVNFVPKHSLTMKIGFASACIVGAAVLLSSCKKDDPDIPNEEEVITTLQFLLTPVGGGTDKTLVFTDLDGDGGNAPVITADDLEAGTTYMAEIVLLNETESPAEIISEEVLDEAEEHQFFFISTVPDLAVTYDDADANGNPIGLACTVQTGAVGSGSLTIILRHEPDKDAPGVSGGNPDNAGGETDIEVTFGVNVVL